MPDSIPSEPICVCEEDTRWCDGNAAITYTYNHDIQSLSDKMNRFIIEVGLSESANIHIVNEFDLARFNAYLEGIRVMQSWINATPQLDLPNTYPRKHCLAMIQDVPTMESDAARMLIRILELMRDELIRGQSSRAASGLNTFDDTRLTSTIDKVQALLDTATDSGMDYPNSSPLTSVVGSGAVNPLSTGK